MTVVRLTVSVSKMSKSQLVDEFIKNLPGEKVFRGATKYHT